MKVDAMEHYGLVKPLTQAGYFKTDHNQQMLRDIRGSILEGRLIAICGVVGCGKTKMIHQLQQQLRDENRVLVSKSIQVEKINVKLGTLITALFIDLSPEKQPQIPSQGERRERALREAVKKCKRPVALFVDEAHDLNRHTLIGLKRLTEVVEDGDGRLSVVLIGHPKLRNDLRRPTMEEIGQRTDVFTFDGIAGKQHEYINWLINACTEGAVTLETILTLEALDLLATKLRTPLQIEHHIKLALEAGYLAGEKPISVSLVESILSKQLNDLEPTLARHGYRIKDLAEQFDVKPNEVKALLSGQLDPTRTVELRDRMLAAGLPL